MDTAHIGEEVHVPGKEGRPRRFSGVIGSASARVSLLSLLS